MSSWGSGFAFLGRGRCSCVPHAKARHHPRTGHSPPRGPRGTHTVAPSSITAWFRSPGRSPGTSASASAHSSASAGAGSSVQRAKTRRTFPSTSGSARPKAMDITAPAV